MSARWQWKVWKQGEEERSGACNNRNAAEYEAENATRHMGFKGTVATVTSPRGGVWYWTPKERTSGMKWDRRE